ncbi:MAG TPA: TlpA disulfide reductase family protein [Pirellulales bacterium]|nr:TlpA disulfide reductase family protein [Pirellulales bacterium]
MFSAVRVLVAASSPILFAAAALADEKANQSDQPATPLPRYRLQVGQQLDYEVDESHKSDRGEMRFATELRCLVVGTNQDGSWRIVISERTWRASGKEPITRDAQPGRASLEYFDLPADGGDLGDRTVRRIFPRLPDERQQLAAGWNAEYTHGTDHYEIESREDGHVRISAVETGPLFDLYQWTFKTSYDFDQPRGLVDRAVNKSSREARPAFDRMSETRLMGSEILGAEAVSQLADEIRAYVDALNDYRRQIELAVKDADRSEMLCAGAKNRLQLAASLLTAPMVKAQAEATLASHDATTSRAKRVADRRAKVIGKGVPDFETTDLDGHPFSLKDLRGKVVVLDFWFRACEPCIMAMPQISKVARAFAGKPVAVIGMNTDENIVDAKYVVEKLRLDYTSVRAEGSPKEFHVEVFPGLVVVDRNGIVREYHEGAVPTLAADLSASINALLAESK